MALDLVLCFLALRSRWRGVGVLAVAPLRAFCVAWLLVAGSTLEMALNDLVGPALFSRTIAAVKGGGAGAGADVHAALRRHPDLCNPAWPSWPCWPPALVHRLHPELCAADSLRSLVGSVAPFAFGFARLPRTLGAGDDRAPPIWCPLRGGRGRGRRWRWPGCARCSSTAAAGGWPGLGHPGVPGRGLPAAIYACLIELCRERPDRCNLILLAANFADPGADRGARAAGLCAWR